MLKSLRLSLATGLLGLGALAVSPATAAATSGAHFFKDTSASVANSGALTVHIDEAGLGDGTTTNYTVSSQASATYACINGGGNHPKAANKQTFSEALSAEASFQPKNGRVQADISVGPISAGSFTCPSGQRLVLAAVSYSNVVLTDTSNNVTDNLGSVSRTFINL
jgi:hypothetical protein